MAFAKDAGGSGVKKLVNTTSTTTVSNPVNTGSSKIGGVLASGGSNKPTGTGNKTPVSGGGTIGVSVKQEPEVSNPVNTGSFNKAKEKAQSSSSGTTNIASNSNFAVLEPYVNNNNDWERQEQERLLAEERRMAEEQRRQQEELRRQQEEAQRLAELRRQQEEARRAKEEARRQQLQALQEESNRATEELQARTEQPSAGYIPYGDQRLNPNSTAPVQNPLIQGAVSRLSRGNSSYVGNEQPNDYAELQARQNLNKATGLIPLAEYTPTEQSKNAFKAGARASAINDETEFYTGNPELDTDVYVTDPLAYRMNVPGLPGVGPTITTNPIELGIQNSIQEYNNSNNPLKEWLAKSYPKYTGNNDARQPYAGFYNGRELMQPLSTPQNNVQKYTGEDYWGPEAVRGNDNYTGEYNGPAWPGFMTKAEMSVRNTWNKIMDAADIARGEREWIEAQTKNINFDLLNPEEAAALQKNLHDQYQGMIASGEVTTPEPRPLVTSNEINERKAKEYEEEKARRTAAKERIANDNAFDDATLELAKDAAEKKGLDPNSVEYWEEISKYRDNAVADKKDGIMPEAPKDPYKEAREQALKLGLKSGTYEYNNFVNQYVNGNPFTGNSVVSVQRDMSGNPVYNMGKQTSTGDLALEASIRNGETTYEKVYDDYVASHKEKMGEQDARRAAYQKIYDLGYRPDVNDPNESWRKYTNDMTDNEALIYDLEKAMKNNYYQNGASYLDRVINMLAGGFDRSYEQDRDFYDLTSELAGNAFANQYEWTGKAKGDGKGENSAAYDKKGKFVERQTPGTYNTTPGYTTDDKGNPLANGALQAGLSGQLSPDQILHFYDAGYSDLVIPEKAKDWFASDSTHALNQLYLNNGENQGRLEKNLGSEDEMNEALRSLINANPSLKALYDSGRLSMDDIALNFMKAPVDNKGDLVGSYANGGSGGGKTTTFTPSYGQGGTGVKAPYKSGGYTDAELQAMGNMPYTDRYGRTQYEGYYLAPDGNWYPVDQEKAAYYKKYGTYDGWDEGMRKYYNTFGTFYGYTPTWRTTGRKTGSNYYSGGRKSYSYNRSGSNYNSSGYGSGSNSNYTNYYTPNRITNSGVSPSTLNQKQNRIYNIMKNWSF